MSATDRIIAGAAGATVVVLAGVAGAISYSHMAELARLHGEVGWRSHAFPVSVDGIEIVASLVLLAHRRPGTRAGWLPWAALATGTAASVAANVAVGASDPIGRLVAGWPAVALLVAIKLLSGLLDAHPTDGARDRSAVADGPASRSAGSGEPGLAVDGPADPDSVSGGLGVIADSPAGPHGPRSGPDGPGSGVGGPGSQPGDPGSGSGSPGSDGAGSVMAGSARAHALSRRPGVEVVPAELENAARIVRDQLIASGSAVTRRTLASGLRAAGHRVRNDRLGHLLLVATTGDLPDPPSALVGAPIPAPGRGGRRG